MLLAKKEGQERRAGVGARMRRAPRGRCHRSCCWAGGAGARHCSPSALTPASAAAFAEPPQQQQRPAGTDHADGKHPGAGPAPLPCPPSLPAHHQAACSCHWQVGRGRRTACAPSKAACGPEPLRGLRRPPFTPPAHAWPPQEPFQRAPPACSRRRRRRRRPPRPRRPRPRPARAAGCGRGGQHPGAARLEAAQPGALCRHRAAAGGGPRCASCLWRLAAGGWAGLGTVASPLIGQHLRPG